MKQAAEFLSAGGQAAEADATHGCCVVSHDGHRDLYLSPVPPFVTQLGRTPIRIKLSGKCQCRLEKIHLCP